MEENKLNIESEPKSNCNYCEEPPNTHIHCCFCFVRCDKNLQIEHETKCSFKFCKICLVSNVIEATQYFCKKCKISLCKSHFDHLDHQDCLVNNSGKISQWLKEGIDTSSNIITWRKTTCQHLLNELILKGLLLIKAPPYSGKSALCALLENYLNNTYPQLKTFRVPLRLAEKSKEYDDASIKFSFQQGIKKTYQDLFSDVNSMKNNTSYILIIDEAQKLYKNCEVFLDSVKEAIKDKKIYVICFAGYGVLRPMTKITTPIHFQDQKNIHTLKLREEEYNELIESYQQSNEGRTVPLSEAIISYIKDLTDGHVGLVKCTLENIYTAFKSYETRPMPHDIFDYLLSKKYMDLISSSRCLSQDLSNLSEKQKSIIDEIRIKQFLRWDEKLKEDLSFLVLTGLLYVDTSIRKGDIVRFSSHLIAKMYYDRFLRKNIEICVPKDLKIFIKDILRRIPKDNLITCYSSRRNGIIYEKHWQNEFYKAMVQILDKDVSLNVEVPPCYFPQYEQMEMEIEEKLDIELAVEQEEEEEEDEEEKEKEKEFQEIMLEEEDVNKEIKRLSGYLDFYINDKHCWGIELLIHGRRLSEHMKRFLKRGRYSGMRFKDYLVVDLRKKFNENSIYLQKKNYMAVVYAENFEKFIVYHGKEKSEIPIASSHKVKLEDLNIIKKYDK